MQRLSVPAGHSKVVFLRIGRGGVRIETARGEVLAGPTYRRISELLTWVAESGYRLIIEPNPLATTRLPREKTATGALMTATQIPTTNVGVPMPHSSRKVWRPLLAGFVAVLAAAAVAIFFFAGSGPATHAKVAQVPTPAVAPAPAVPAVPTAEWCGAVRRLAHSDAMQTLDPSLVDATNRLVGSGPQEMIGRSASSPYEAGSLLLDAETACLRAGV
jgi:hypothetical protein